MILIKGLDAPNFDTPGVQPFTPLYYKGGTPQPGIAPGSWSSFGNKILHHSTLTTSVPRLYIRIVQKKTPCYFANTFAEGHDEY